MAAIGKAAAIFNITVDTARGAMSAYASLAGIPIIGPSLGIAAATAVVAYGAEQIATATGTSFAVGTAELPSDMMAQVHAGEMIIPSTFAESIRSGDLTLGGQSENVATGQGSGGNTFNINFEGANFYGEMTDEMVIDLGTRLSELINEDLLLPIPTRSA